MFSSGRYVFLMRLREPDTLEVGALGRFLFPAGWYAYTGSAKRALKKRVERHWSPTKKLRWHIDYLSTASSAEPIGAVLVPIGALAECDLNQRVGLVVTDPSPAPGFGASDCREKCAAHLWFSATPISLLQIARVHAETALITPEADFEHEDLPGLGQGENETEDEDLLS